MASKKKPVTEAELDAQIEARKAKEEIEKIAGMARRARELLEGADWVFGAYVEKLQRDWINSEPTDKDAREAIYNRLRAVAEVKRGLAGIIDKAANDEAIREYIAKRTGK
jgi:hypothetical protein